MGLTLGRECLFPDAWVLQALNSSQPQFPWLKGGGTCPPRLRVLGGSDHTERGREPIPAWATCHPGDKVCVPRMKAHMLMSWALR